MTDHEPVEQASVGYHVVPCAHCRMPVEIEARPESRFAKHLCESCFRAAQRSQARKMEGDGTA